METKYLLIKQLIDKVADYDDLMNQMEQEDEEFKADAEIIPCFFFIFI